MHATQSLALLHAPVFRTLYRVCIYCCMQHNCIHATVLMQHRTRTVGMSGLSDCRNEWAVGLSDGCTVGLSDKQTVADSGRTSSRAVLLSELSDTVGLSDCRTCRTVGKLSDTVGIHCRTVGPGSDYQQLSTHPQSDFLDHTGRWVGQQFACV